MTQETPAKTAWDTYTPEQLDTVMTFADNYMQFISEGKTERRVVDQAIALARGFGYRDMNEVIFNHETLKAGDKVWFNMMGKAIALVQLGSDPLEQGMNILCAHIDSPRLDLKPRPLYEADGLCLLDTHYYGGIKKYQWTALPLALYGVVVLKDGTQMDVAIGDHEDDPVFVVTDLLPHLAAEQMKKSAPTVVEGEDLNVLFGSIPEKGTDKDPVKANILKLLKDAYGIDEADFISAELEVVPQGKARTLGLDKSMVLGYGQDDCSCAYPSLIAQLECGPVKRTAMTILADKEEIGSVGATGMQSRFFENLVAELLHAQGNDSLVALNRTCRTARRSPTTSPQPTIPTTPQPPAPMATRPCSAADSPWANTQAAAASPAPTTPVRNSSQLCAGSSMTTTLCGRCRNSAKWTWEAAAPLPTCSPTTECRSLTVASHS